MLKSLFNIARPMLFRFEPEEAHELTLRSLELGLYPRCPAVADTSIGTTLWGLHFASPIGVAAGFDKDARVVDAVIGMGCGFAEIGTTTPHPQEGNPRPRVYRLAGDGAIINRLGFNNGGHAAALARLKARTGGGIVGVNIGANKDSADRIQDYVTGLETFYDVAQYFTVNISSPNTPGLRDLQAPQALDDLLGRVMAARARLVDGGKPKRPIVVKLAPDIAADDLEPIAAVLLKHEVDGIAVSNTTLSRRGLVSVMAKEVGGLSGRPLFQRATIMLARVHQATGGRVPLIGIGGIDTGAAAVSKIEAGASLLQLYTGLIYKGPALISEIKGALSDAVRDRGVRSIEQLVGTRSKEWAEKPLD